MRIAAGVIMLLVGILSFGRGGCSVVGSTVVGGMAAGTSALSDEFRKMAEKAGAKVDAQAAAKAAQGLDEVRSKSGGLMVSGIVLVIAGVLCLVGGIFFFLNKGKGLAFAAVGLGVLGEVLAFAMVGFHFWGVVMIGLLGFCGFAATKLGAPPAAAGA